MHAPVKSVVHVPSFAELRRAPVTAWNQLGCADTLREILLQPDTWRATSKQLQSPTASGVLNAAVRPAPARIVLTGSGSSLHIAECVAPVLIARLHVPCYAVGGDVLLTTQAGALPDGGGLLVSIARSGDSPESTGGVDAALATRPKWVHLIVTCNAEGRLAKRYGSEQRVRVLVLGSATNDRSLVMTGSFTNLALAVSGLSIDSRDGDAAARILEALFDRYASLLGAWGTRVDDAAVYLGSGANWGAARESALKMLEMSGGAIRVMPETSLGLRHGPMAWLNRDSLVVSFLSSDVNVRAYEEDLLRELTDKHLGRYRIVVGEGINTDVVGADGLAVDVPGLFALPPVQQAMVHVAVGQLLAFFQCLALGERPDAPSDGVLTRVVHAFALHTGART